jgi:hypothetical protein
MTKRVQQDIRQSKYEKKKILMHEDKEEVCNTNKCIEIKRKVKKTEGEDKIDESVE